MIPEPIPVTRISTNPRLLLSLDAPTPFTRYGHLVGVFIPVSSWESLPTVLSRNGCERDDVDAAGGEGADVDVDAGAVADDCAGPCNLP